MATKIKKIFCILTLLCLTIPCFSQVLNSAMIKKLRIVPVENQQFFTNNTIQFEVVIPYVKSNEIEITPPAEQNNVSLQTLRRLENYSENGIKIEMWMSFAEKGEYKLNPLGIIYKGTNYKLYFEDITINVNPLELNPVLLIYFNDGTSISSEDFTKEGCIVQSLATGQKIRFRVFLKYAVQLVQYDWELPKDAIFTETNQYDIMELKPREKKYSEDLIPVADYEMIPLVAGKIELPVFKSTATGYNGKKHDLQLPKLYLQVMEDYSVSKTSVEADCFNDAFDFSDYDELEGDEIKITDEMCYEIALLRAYERYSFNFSSQKKRSEYEKINNLPYEQNEFPIIFLIISIFFVVLFVILLIIFIRRKKPGAYILFASLSICAIVFMIVSAVKSSYKYGISRGCIIYSIPEASAESKSEIPAGNRVAITEAVGDWIYVELGENGGWCKKNEVIVIDPKLVY